MKGTTVKRYTTYLFVGFAFTLASIQANSPQSENSSKVQAPPLPIPQISKQGETGLKFGFINSFEAMRNCAEGQRIAQGIETKRAEMTKELEEDQNAIMKLANDYQTKASVLSEAARQDMEKQIRRMRTDYETKVKESQYELETMISKDTEVLAHAVEQACKPLAIANNLDVIIDEATGRTFYVRDDARHTETLVVHMDKTHKSGEKQDTMLAQAPAVKKDQQAA